VEGRAPFLDIERLSDHVGGNLVWYRRVGSTNDAARAEGRDGAADESLVVAEEQLAGRGRRDRVWHSPAGLGVYATVLVRRGSWLDRPALAQLGAGLAVAEAVAEYTDAEVELIWPNDCYAAGAKLAGVLVEAEATGSSMDFLACGLGINVNQTRDEMPEELRSHAVSVSRLAGRCIDRTDLLIDLLTRIRVLRDLTDRGGAAPLLERWTSRSPSSMDSEVQVDTIEGILSGQTAGLTAEGALRVKVDGLVREITVGELVRVRRRR